jgi:hypothetical protein
MESALSIVDLTYRSTRSTHYSGENEAPSGVGAKYAPKGVKSENLALPVRHQKTRKLRGLEILN